MNYSSLGLERIFQLSIPFELQNPNLSVEDCANHIKDVDHPKEAALSDHTIAASAVQSLQDEYHYYITIEHQRHERYGWYTTARLDGELRRGTNTDATIAIGKAQISSAIMRRVVGYIMIGLTVFWLFGSAPTPDLLTWLIPLICFGAAGYYYWTGLTDRDSLLSAIDYLMTEARSFSFKDKYQSTEVDEMVEMTFSDQLPQFQIFDETPEKETQPSVTSMANKQ